MRFDAALDTKKTPAAPMWRAGAWRWYEVLAVVMALAPLAFILFGFIFWQEAMPPPVNGCDVAPEVREAGCAYWD